MHNCALSVSSFVFYISKSGSLDGVI
uniref:Uncharacterized protein n=1 Tax=Anguilla anguilla TaxID=7936 RepID=A0A0E9PRJ2_ANGAN